MNLLDLKPAVDDREIYELVLNIARGIVALARLGKSLEPSADPLHPECVELLRIFVVAVGPLNNTDECVVAVESCVDDASRVFDEAMRIFGHCASLMMMRATAEPKG